MSIARAGLALTSTWTALAIGRLVAPSVGAECATVGSFALAWGIVAWWDDSPRRKTGMRAASVFLAVGYLAMPAVLILVWKFGTSIGLSVETLPPATPPFGGTAPGWFAAVVLAPAFEERLYRGMLLRTVQRYAGRIGAIVITSALFAIPHGGTWPMLSAVVVGVFLATIVISGATPFESAFVHAGLNLACIVCGVPALQFFLSPASSFICAAILVVAILLPRRLARGWAGPASAMPRRTSSWAA